MLGLECLALSSPSCTDTQATLFALPLLLCRVLTSWRFSCAAVERTSGINLHDQEYASLHFWIQCSLKRSCSHAGSLHVLWNHHLQFSLIHPGYLQFQEKEVALWHKCFQGLGLSSAVCHPDLVAMTGVIRSYEACPASLGQYCSQTQSKLHSCSSQRQKLWGLKSWK